MFCMGTSGDSISTNSRSYSVTSPMRIWSTPKIPPNSNMEEEVG